MEDKTVRSLRRLTSYLKSAREHAVRLDEILKTQNEAAGREFVLRSIEDNRNHIAGLEKKLAKLRAQP